MYLPGYSYMSVESMGIRIKAYGDSLSGITIWMKHSRDDLLLKTTTGVTRQTIV